MISLTKKMTVVLLLCLGTVLYAVDVGDLYTETYMSFGPSFKNSISVTGDTIYAPGNNKGMGGLNFNFFGFWNGSSIGVFAVYNNLMPVYASALEKREQIAAYDGGMMNEMGLGVGYRRSFTSRFSILSGVGLTMVMDIVNLELANKDRDATTFFDFGVVSEGGMKFDMTSALYLTFGIKGAYTFMRYTSDPDGQEFGFVSNVSINPFIGIGLNMVNYTGGWHKWGKLD